MTNVPYSENLFGDPEVGMRTHEDVRRSAAEKFEDYEGFVEKFKPKKTTDDCYTPENVYNVVRQWVDENICPLQGRRIVRPFYPGGDYTAFEYLPDDIVLDNPPFSILAEIRRYYNARGIKYFLFAPGLTLFSGGLSANEAFIVINAMIVYENGAKVATGFVTNCSDRGMRIMARGDLSERLRAINKGETNRPKLKYPMEVVTPATLRRIARNGIIFEVPAAECERIASLDQKKDIFGGAYIISERAAAERAAAERAAVIQLSERERAIVKRLQK